MDDLIKRKDAERALTVLGAQLSEGHHRTVAKCICAIKDVPAAEGSEGCEWCKPSDEGDYTMSAFVNPNNPEQEAMLSVYGGQIVMEIKLEDSSPKARMAVKINHCPFCGRAFKEAERNGNQADPV